MGALLRLIRRFGSDQGGNVAVTFVVAAIPLFSGIGCAVDYSMAMRMKAKLQGSADSASVGSLSVGSPAYVAAGQMGSTGPIPAGVTDATNLFNANMSGVTGLSNLQVTANVNKTNTNITSQVSYSADVPTTFLSLIGYRTITVTGNSSSSGSLPMYLDFYLALDVSGSMGLPSTSDEAARMQAINPDNWVQYRTGCTLACHFAPRQSACVDPPVTPPTAPAANPPTTTTSYTQQYNTNHYCMGYAYSRVNQTALKNLLNMASTSTVRKQVPGFPVSMISGLPASLNNDPTYGLPAVANCPSPGTDDCIQLRLDAVGYAVNQLFATANSSMKLPQQFRIGLYPFIRYLYSSYFPLTSSINGSPTNPSTINYAAANLASLLDTNMDSNLGSGGTHIDTALSSLNTLITNVGNGSAWNNTLPYVFLVTDGAQDNQVKGVPNGSWSGSNHATVINPTTVCKPLKDRGIVISVLYIPYQQINPVNTSFAGNEDTYANNNIASIPSSLQNCASPGFFYTANSPQDIANALNQMFNHALITAHITH